MGKSYKLQVRYYNKDLLSFVRSDGGGGGEISAAAMAAVRVCRQDCQSIPLTPAIRTPTPALPRKRMEGAIQGEYGESLSISDRFWRNWQCFGGWLG